MVSSQRHVSFICQLLFKWVISMSLPLFFLFWVSVGKKELLSWFSRLPSLLLLCYNPFCLSRTRYLNCFKAKSNSRLGLTRAPHLLESSGRSCWTLRARTGWRTAALLPWSSSMTGWRPMALRGDVCFSLAPVGPTACSETRIFMSWIIKVIKPSVK